MSWPPRQDAWSVNLQKSLTKRLKELKMAEVDGVKIGTTKINTTKIAIDADLEENLDLLQRKNITSDGNSADYYKLPPGATEIQDLISFKNMNAQVGEMFRALYRFGQCSHSDEVREINKIIFYGQAELERLEKYGKK